MIRILGARGTIHDVEVFMKKILAFTQQHHVTVQVMNAALIYGEYHLLSAAEHALRAIRQKTNTTNSLAMEILLYASGERQIKLAIPKLGVKKGGGTIALIVVDDIEDVAEANGTLSDQQVDDLVDSLGFMRDDAVLQGDKDTLLRFGITEEEIRTITKAKYGDLILEKVAMVDVIK